MEKKRNIIVFPLKKEKLELDAEKVFNEWCDLRVSIGKRKPTITKKRKKLIENVIKKFGLEDCLLVLKYLSTAKEDYAKFIRTEMCGKYTSLETIFRITKFEDKLELAKDWEFDQNKNKTEDCHVPYTIVFGDKK